MPRQPFNYTSGMSIFLISKLILKCGKRVEMVLFFKIVMAKIDIQMDLFYFIWFVYGTVISLLITLSVFRRLGCSRTLRTLIMKNNWSSRGFHAPRGTEK